MKLTKYIHKDEDKAKQHTQNYLTAEGWNKRNRVQSSTGHGRGSLRKNYFCGRSMDELSDQLEDYVDSCSLEDDHVR